MNVTIKFYNMKMYIRGFFLFLRGQISIKSKVARNDKGILYMGSMA